MTDIKRIVAGISHLRPIPQSYNRIMALAGDLEVDTTELATAVARDPVLTANLLKYANSAYYGRPGRFETVEQAVVFLGILEVFNLVLMAGCRDALSASQEGYDLQAGELWQYSLSSALMARAAAERSPLADPQRVFTAALLKDIGKVVLSQHVAAGYEEIRRLVDGEGHSFRQAERVVLGIDHAELGAMVATVWRFSAKLVSIIRHHHQPLACEAAPYDAACVYLGDILGMMLGVGVGSDGLAYRFQAAVLGLLELSETDLQLLLAECGALLATTADLVDAPAPETS